jgi:hypothetical protein
MIKCGSASIRKAGMYLQIGGAPENSYRAADWSSVRGGDFLRVIND